MTRADLLLVGGTVHVRPGETTDALAVADGRVVAVGADATALDAAETVSLDGGALLPAFRDGHVHPLWGGVELSDAPIRDCTSVDAVVDAVRRHAAAHPDLTWVLGGSFDPALRADGRYDAAWLDAVVSDRPVVLTTADHHAVWCNSEALRRAAIDSTTPDPPTGRILRRDDGTPLGTLVEWAAMRLVERHVPSRSTADKRAGVAAASRMLAAAGVVWAQEAALAPEDVAVYVEAADAGELAVRVNVALRAEPDRWRAQLPDFVETRESVVHRDDVTARTVKLFADGVVEHGTAAMLEPWTDNPASCGHPVWPADEMAAAVTAFDAAGFQVHIHAIGDAGIRSALDAIEHATRRNPRWDRRAVLAHVQVVDDADRDRFAALGVIANFEPLWAQPDPVMLDLTLPRLGPQRSRRQYPIASLLRSGAPVSFGSDWPVSSMRPLDYLRVAVARQTANGQPPGGWLPEQRVDLAAAWTASSRGVAYQAYDDRAGTLEPGMRADLVLVGADPFTVDVATLPQLAVLGTWLGGRRTHRG